MYKLKVAACLLGLLWSRGLSARSWKVCGPTCARAARQLGKRYDVVPLGYPYGNDRQGGPYLAPYAGPYREQFGWPYTFGYDSLWGRPR